MGPADMTRRRPVRGSGVPGRWLCAALLLVGRPVGTAAQEPGTCADTVIAGRVERGDTFRAGLPGGLAFRLVPAIHPQNPQGWTIQVTPPGRPDLDYSMVATPPFRSSNPRYVDTGYGLSAEDALAWTPREFAWVATEEDYGAARGALDALLWPGTRSEAEVEGARAAWEALPKMGGRLVIVDGEVGPPDAEAADAGPVIRWMAFRVVLCGSGAERPAVRDPTAGRRRPPASPASGAATR